MSKWKKDFPKVGLVVEGKKKFHPLYEAVPIWDNGGLKVESASNEVLEKDFSVRQMTDNEIREFQRRTDEYSISK